MHETIKTLAEEFHIKNISSSLNENQEHILEISGSNDEYVLNCYYIYQSTVNFNLTIVPLDSTKRFSKRIRTPVPTITNHDKYISQWVVWVAHHFNAENNPVNLFNLFKGSNIKITGLPASVFPVNKEFEYFLDGYLKSITTTTSIYSFRHVLDNSTFGIEDPYLVSYTYAFLIRNDPEILGFSYDSYGSKYNPLPPHWILHLKTSFDNAAMKKRIDTLLEKDTHKYKINLKTYDIEFDQLEEFLSSGKGFLNLSNISGSTIMPLSTQSSHEVRTNIDHHNTKIDNTVQKKNLSSNRAIFIVHGHDTTNAEKLKNFLYDINRNITPVILKDVISEGSPTIIEKLEKYGECEYAFIIMTPDDVFEKTEIIKSKENSDREVKKIVYRARQNVIFEYGYFVAKLTRNKLAVIYKDNMEIPSDIQGVEYIPIRESIDEVQYKIVAKLEKSNII